MSIIYSESPKLYINELLASNASNNPDPDLSDFCDWIEIYNSEDTVVNIGISMASINIIKLSNPN